MSVNEGIKRNRYGLEEFEKGTVTGLAPFEDESGILLEEFSSGLSARDMLAEFDPSVEKIYLDGILGSLDDDEMGEGVEEIPGPGEVPAEVGKEIEEPSEDEIIPDDDETLEPGAEQQYIEVAEPPEPEPEPEIREGPMEPKNPIIGFVCECAYDVSREIDPSGKMFERPNVRLISLPCAGMIKPSWIKTALAKGASGVFVVSCTPGSCKHRRGAEVAKGRWDGERRPLILSSCDRRRLRYFGVQPAEGRKVIAEIDKFLVDLGRLDAVEEPPKPRKVDRAAKFHWPDF